MIHNDAFLHAHHVIVTPEPATWLTMAIALAAFFLASQLIKRLGTDKESE